jgi:hypothetical protein
LLEIIKIVITFLSGGAAGALLKEWFSRRKGKVQPISLIERVNRSVSPELEGITLARLPVLVRSDLSVGLSDGTMKKIPIQIYAEQ